MIIWQCGSIGTMVLGVHWPHVDFFDDTLLIKCILPGLAYLTRVQSILGRPESVFISLLTAWVLGSVINSFYKGKWRKRRCPGSYGKK